MARVWRRVFIGGTLQVTITITLASSLFYFYSGNIRIAIFAGFLTALSSTAMVLKLLIDKGEINTLQGGTVTGILIFQDLCVIPMMLITPLLAGETGGSGALIKMALLAVGMVGFVIVGTRWVVPWILFETVKTRNRELFIIVILVLCLGTAYISHLVGLSLALGAFLAGMMISDSEYSHQVVADILPFRDSMNSIFFVSIGMLLELQYIYDNFSFVLFLTLLIFFIKLPAGFIAVMAMKYPARIALGAGIAIAQIGEFSFILLQFGKSLGMDLGELYQPFLASAIITMASTPFTIMLGAKIIELTPNFFTKIDEKKLGDQKSYTSYSKQVRDHVIIIGYGLNGRNLSKVLKATGVPYHILEANPMTVRKYIKEKEPIHYGDATKEHLLKHVHIESARVLVIAISDPAMERRIIPIARQINPAIHITARTRFVSEIEPLIALGANEVIPEEFETSIEIFAHVLAVYEVPHDVITQQIEAVRSSAYMMLRSLPKRGTTLPLYSPLQERYHTEAITVPKNSLANGKSIKELNIRATTGALVLAVNRYGNLMENPSADFTFAPYDVVHLVGTPEENNKANSILTSNKKS